MERPNKFRFSLKTLLVIPFVVLIALVWINIQFRKGVSSTKVGFGTTLNGLYGAEDAHDQLGTWLESNDYKRVDRPKFGPHYSQHRESWYLGICNNVEHYVYVRSSDSYLGADVHYEAQKWMFETRQNEETATNKVVGRIAAWWDANSFILTTSN